MQVTVILPPWLSDRGERDALARTGAALAAGGQLDVLACTGAADVAALVQRAAQELQAEAGLRRLVVLPAGPEGEQAAALIAVRLGGAPLGRCTHLAVEGGIVAARRAVFGGRAEIELRSQAALTCATFSADAGAAASAPLPPMRGIALDAPPAFEAEPVAETAAFPRVEGAPLVVSGGRGIGTPEGFDLLARIARAVGAGVGGSLPAVDAGWVPVAHQVGQSGKFVSPRLYFAVAISGTPQHLAGIAPAARIVALNSDADAPIFARCDVGVLGDWREILPLVAARLESPP